MSKQTELKIKLPASALPLLRGLAEVSEQTTEEAAAYAVLHWMQSEDAMSRIDDKVNLLLRKFVR